MVHVLVLAVVQLEMSRPQSPDSIWLDYQLVDVLAVDTAQQ